MPLGERHLDDARDAAVSLAELQSADQLDVEAPAGAERRFQCRDLFGEFVGALDNAGENLRIDDAVGEKILDFEYNNSWYPITDGPGASLVIVNENAPWDTWGMKSSWRPSAIDFGSATKAYSSRLR